MGIARLFGLLALSVALLLGYSGAARAATAPYTVTLTLSPASIPAGGVATTATATVTDANGNPVPQDTVAFASTDAGEQIATPSAVTDANGVATTLIASSSAVGQATITATDTSANAASPATQTLTQTPAAASISVALSPSIVAAGTGTTTATVTVTDGNGNPVANDPITIQQPGGPTTALGLTDGSGTASAQLTATSALGQQTITATDGSSPAILGASQMTQYGSPAQITVQAAVPSSLTAGQAANVTATVQDSVGDWVPLDPGLTVSWSGSSVSMSPSPTTPGTFTGPTPPLTRAGTDTVTVSDTSGAAPGTASFTVVPGPRANLTFVGGFIPSSIPADHNSTASIQVSVTDAYGNGISGQPLSASSSDAGQAVSWIDNGGGTYTITVRSSYTPATSVVSIADGVAVLTKSLGQTSAATGINLSLGASTLTADGRSHTNALITLHDEYGAPLPGDVKGLRLTASDPHVGIGHITDLGNGLYSATVTSSLTAHPVSLTASETGAHLSSSTGLLLVAGAPAELSVHVNPAVLTANGLATAALTLTLTDAHGNAIGGAVPQLTATPSGIHFGRLTDLGGGHYATTLRASNRPGTITVTARDGAATGATTLTETIAPSVLATVSMQWSFRYTRSYTAIEALSLTGAPIGSQVIEICRGKSSCPFHRVAATVRPVRCTKAHHGACPTAGGVNVLHGLRLHELRPGTVLIVQIVRRGWIGKYYEFVIRGGRAPQITISCLAPGGSHPGAGCQ